ncbi:DNA-3-methyladenine glycosylase family protein [Acidocella facilis]|uniref:DNA-3-methyladenine glycosylase family protein n=1 Tax=Acidocella facilis TaxID=525 RepID=UPI001F350587|nr:DNA-3-methyladenine glycosylase [Acidocella facilis]
MDDPLPHLSKADPRLGDLIKRLGKLPRVKPEHKELYHALFSAIAHQQLHAKAAQSILGRLRSACGETLPDSATLLALPDSTLRACGFSGSKVAALRDVAAKAADGTIPSRRVAKTLTDEELIARLITIRGVGRWTVEMILIFTLERPDIFPVDDFGVREGYRILHGLEAQPKPKAFIEIGKAYAPHRTLAARYLWRAADELKKPGTIVSKA